MSRAAFAQQVRDDAVREDQIAAAAEIARASMPPVRVAVQVTITWIAIVDEFPDADLSVLVSISGGTEPVWFGFTDGESWFDACTGEQLAGSVTHWAELPIGVVL